MEELLDRYTARILAGDEKGADEMLRLLPAEFEELKEIMGLVKELNLIYRPLRPSLSFQNKLFSLIRAKFKPSPLKVFAQWACEHKRALAIGTALAGSACSLVGLIVYYVKVKKAAA
ncbi:MAG: hypothetical protein RMK30_02080 [Anaerolineae bacterium]|nr:hypothetical protein [Anaerolineae bacterium]MDW8101651.1 hypothetical protein [Anaerolineae bacterium]